jgi:hypothetical protein
MNSHDFDIILSERIIAIKKTLGSKAKEYAIGDRLYNFKRAAEILRTTPQKALVGMFVKHLVSVMDLIEGSIEPTEYMVNEKIGDAINYLILLEAIFKEQKPIVIEGCSPCLLCGDCGNSEPTPTEQEEK